MVGPQGGSRPRRRDQAPEPSPAPGCSKDRCAGTPGAIGENPASLRGYAGGCGEERQRVLPVHFGLILPNPTPRRIWFARRSGLDYTEGSLERRLLDDDAAALGRVIRWVSATLTSPRFWSLREEWPD